MSHRDESDQIIPQGPRSLAKISSSIVRRGLDDLSKSESKKGRVLLVNNQESYLEVMEKVLVANGYEVWSTSRQPDAIALAKNFDPQVVVLGITAPQELGRALFTASPSWPLLSPKMVLWGEVIECEDLEQRRDDYDFELLPASANQEHLLSAMQTWMAEAWTQRGNPLRAKRQWLDALICHEKALAIDARCFNAWLNKAWCLDELGRWPEAITCCHAAIEINPSDSMPWLRKGNLLDRAGRSEEAVTCFGGALEIAGSVSGWMGRGHALHHLGRYDEALGCFDRVLEIELPGYTDFGRAHVYSDAWNSKGTSYYRMRRHRKSIECYDRAIALDPNCEIAWYNKGNSLRMLNRFDEAIRCYDKSIELWPEHGASWNKLPLFRKARVPNAGDLTLQGLAFHRV
jgi:tetratricopeptide (TPR) repeat protein